MRYDSIFSSLPRIAAVLGFMCVSFSTVKGASAVAVGRDPKSGEEAYGYWKGNNSEAEARNRAIRFCLASEGKNPKIIASTPRRGYGAIVAYRTEGKTRFVVSLAAPTQQRAVGDAIREATLRGARSWAVVQLWIDG